MNYQKHLNVDVKKGDILRVVKNETSFDNGITWVGTCSVWYLPDDQKTFCKRFFSGPSFSQGNRIDSGSGSEWCTKFDGKRFRVVK